MALKNLSKTGPKSDPMENDYANKEKSFLSRVTAQQVLRSHGPLFKSWLRQKNEFGSDESDDDILKNMIKDAKILAFKISAAIKKCPLDQVTLKDAQYHRGEASEIVAFYSDHKMVLDFDKIAQEIADIVHETQSEWVSDSKGPQFKKLSRNGNISLTTLPIAAKLMTLVDVYDFRLGKDYLTSQLLSMIMEKSKDVLDVIEDDFWNKEDRISVMQSLCRESVDLLTPIYYAQVKSMLKILKNIDESRKEDVIKHMNPLANIYDQFSYQMNHMAHLNKMAVTAVVEKSINKPK